MVPDKVKHLPKGKNESEKMRKEFSGLKKHQDWSSAKSQRNRRKAKGKHKAIAKVGDLVSVQLKSSIRIQDLIRKIIRKDVSELYLPSTRKE